MKKWMICVCLMTVVLSGCGSKSVQNDMSTEEAVSSEQQIFADNEGESDNSEELLEDMVNDAVDDSVEIEQETGSEEELWGVFLTEIPDEYEKVWELDKDNILVEFYNSSDGKSCICKCTNRNSFDVNVDVEYKFRSAEPLDHNNMQQNAGNYTLTANQVYYDFIGRPIELDSWSELNEGRDYWYLLNDEKVVNGVSFEILEWNEERSEVQFQVTNNMDRKATYIDLEWILIEDGNAVDVKHTRVTSWDERPLYPGESIMMTKSPFGDIDSEKQKLMVSYCYDTALRGYYIYEETQEDEEETSLSEDETSDKGIAKKLVRIDTDYGSYVFSVTGVKMVPAGDDSDKKLYQITWEYENIDFGADGSTVLSIPESALRIMDSDGYLVGHRSTFQDGEASNITDVNLKPGEKCKAYCVFDINNEECEYLTVSLDGRDGTTFKVYVEK